MPKYDIGAADRYRRVRSEPDFHEQLYESLRAPPWWLASAATHAVAFLLLSALMGGGVAGPALAEAIDIGVSPPTIDQEPEVLPPIEPRRPLDEPNEIKDIPPVVMDPIAEPDVSEDPDPSENPVDERHRKDGPFLGDGNNPYIGAGGDAGGGRKPFGGRTNPTLRKTAGTALPATDAGLDWLLRHQSVQGNWDCDAFEGMCRKNRCGGGGGPLYDPGVTGLSLLAFLGTGETHKSPKHGRTVRNGLKYLKGVQDAEGCFGPRTSSHFVYNHAIAALAMTEAYGMTLSPLFKSSAESGMAFVRQCQNPYLAWRYGVRPQDNDTSVTGWMVMALKSAVQAGIEIDPDSLDGARAWLDKVTEPEYGRAGYTARGNGPARPQELMDRFPSDRSESMTAVAVLSRIFCGAKPADEMVRKGADLCLRSPPVWDEAAGTVDYYYWYYGTLAMFQVGGVHWQRWNEAMKGAILAHQRMDPTDDRYGSWDPVDPWGADGGRVYATAINTLSLEVYYRYDRVFGVR